MSLVGLASEKAKFCHFTRCFQEQLNALGPHFQSCINHHSGEISVRPRQATRKPKRDRIGRWTDHGNAGGHRHDLFNEHNRRDRQNDIGTACDDLAREVSDSGRAGRGPNIAPRSDFVPRCNRACSTHQNTLCKPERHWRHASGGSLGWKMASRFTPGDRALVCAQAGQAKLSAAVAAVPAMNSRRLMCPP